MGKITDNSLAILRHLSKVSQTGDRTVKRGEIRESLRIPESEFDMADQYLLESGLVKGTLGGDAGSRYLTSLGITILEQSEESSTFWRRNKDEILVGVITGIISYALGLLSGLKLGG
ncbi:MAG: hypothetical protein PHQ43_05975 [Dehalococcoidales bacterium]|nr:hypothetical protein [Dehalococcoidales bacterium]